MQPSSPTSAPARSPWPPRHLSPSPDGPSDGPVVADFIETFCKIDKDTVGGRRGDPVRLRTWQRELLWRLYVRRLDGRRQHRSALIGVARKNGKSAIASGLALFGLLAECEGAEVYGCAGDKDQARIVFKTAKSMIGLDPELSAMVDAKELRLYKDVIEHVPTDSIYRVLSSVADLKEGLNPSLVLFDEVHVQPDDELWNVMANAFGARVDPLMIGITTAGRAGDRHGRDTLCYRLYKHGKRVAAGNESDPSFFFAWWEADEGMAADHRDPAVWAQANPGLGDLVDPEDLESLITKMRESEFRTKRTNIFTSGDEDWLPLGAWDDLPVDTSPWAAGTKIVIGFDGSKSRDSSALVAADVALEPRLKVLHVWERPPEMPLELPWRVDRLEVKQVLRDTCNNDDDIEVVEVAYDPYRWADVMEELHAEGIPTVEFPQNGARMAPACEAVEAAVLEGRQVHDGNEILATHVRNATAHVDGFGTRIEKWTKDSERHIDAAIAGVIARARAVQLATNDQDQGDVADDVW